MIALDHLPYQDDPYEGTFVFELTTEDTSI